LSNWTVSTTGSLNAGGAFSRAIPVATQVKISS